MLDEVLLGLVSSGGAAVVSAAGTDAWAKTRDAVARLLGWRDPEREEAERVALNQTAIILQTDSANFAERERLQTEWQERIRTALRELEGADRDEAAAPLLALLTPPTPQPVAPMSTGNVTSGNGGISIGIVQGEQVTFNTPQQPDPSQG
ncbi:hypothetical protein [Streptomyces sp. NPDC046821]|uniref:hypothetical protein n=1 Tax=Streptomyces sp. NPDC046821 TaxID=3154702 RepID=UPI0033F23796